MKIYKVLATASTLILIQGCTMFEYPFYSSSYSSSYDGSYNDDNLHDTNETVRPSTKDTEDDIPVQMTDKDTQLHDLKPESAPAKNNNKNVLLPIAGELE